MGGTEEQDERLAVVGLVASAGGLQAIGAVLGGLPADLPAALIVAQHLSPERDSHLTDILSRLTTLRVRMATDDDELLPGHVLVVPPARHLIVTSGTRIGLVDTGALPPERPSADLLLATLAVACGPRALAVVLTGRGTDGQAGVRVVRRCGGTVFAQDESTSSEYAMPSAAITAGVVDRVLPLPDIAEAIRAHVVG